ncbi:MAG: hypothetical protein M3Q39_08390 [Actinomycetota bacterium]|nr:hypothetical protein [Actinomycetota bacterium]
MTGRVSATAQWLREVVAGTGGAMSRADADAWYRARSLADLGELTARWLEGGIGSRPGYQPRCGPDVETRRLIPTLAALNRGGYLTNSSQPGEAPTVGYDGRLWSQRAAVSGFTDRATLDRIHAAMAPTCR